MEEPMLRTCVACCETIQEGATICPHCVTASGIPVLEVTTVAKAHKEGVFRKGDVVTKLNGIHVHKVDGMTEIYRNAEKEKPYIVTIVRGGVIQELDLKKSPSRFATFTDYAVPIDFLTGKNLQGHFGRMHRAWSSE